MWLVYIQAYDAKRDFKATSSNVLTKDLVKLAEFVLTTKSGTSIGTKFTPPYACIYMDNTEKFFFKTQELQPSLWLRYIDNIFFIWTHGEAELKKFMEELK